MPERAALRVVHRANSVGEATFVISALEADGIRVVVERPSDPLAQLGFPAGATLVLVADAHADRAVTIVRNALEIPDPEESPPEVDAARSGPPPTEWRRAVGLIVLASGVACIVGWGTLRLVLSVDGLALVMFGIVLCGVGLAMPPALRNRPPAP